jgi:hypothetical protein
MRRRANPLLQTTPRVVVIASVPLRVAEQLRRLVKSRDCSVPQLIADGLDAIEAQQAAPPAGKVAS